MWTAIGRSISAASLVTDSNKRSDTVYGACGETPTRTSEDAVSRWSQSANAVNIVTTTVRRNTWCQGGR